METKAISVELKDADKGIVLARFATLGVKDLDGDIIAPGSIGKQKVVVSPYGHRVWDGAIPVGKGTVSEEGNEALADVRFFLDTQSGREHFTVLKELGGEQEWSFGFDVTEWAEPNEEQRQTGVRRVIKGLKIHEVSPVLIGAGIGTATLATKEAPEPEAAPPAVEPEAVAEPEPEPVPEVEPEPEPDTSAEDAAFKARVQFVMEEYERVRRTLKRLGVAA
jgi:hypothetical protein